MQGFTVDLDPGSYNAMTGFYASSLTISWSEPLTPNGIITNYTFSVEGPLPSTETVTMGTSDITSVIISPMLRPAMDYVVKVSASTVAGSGPSSSLPVSVPEASKHCGLVCLCWYFLC